MDRLVQMRLTPGWHGSWPGSCSLLESDAAAMTPTVCPACRPQLVKGFMQLYSVDQKRSQALEAHAAAFSTVKVPGRGTPSTVISFAQKTFNNGTLTSKLHVIELGAPAGLLHFCW
jgi:hypothetical protein